MLIKLVPKMNLVLLINLTFCGFIQANYFPQGDKSLPNGETTLSAENFARGRLLPPVDLNDDSVPLAHRTDMIEGDIKPPDSRYRQRRNVLRDRTQLWPRGRIPYTVSTQFTTSERDRIAGAMGEIMLRTCVRFEPKQSDDRHYMRVISGDGCYSLVGRSYYPGDNDVSVDKNGCVYHGIIVHELLHTIGVFHEHTRSDRDGFIRVLTENIMPSVYDNFVKLSRTEADLQGITYDYASVMHYGTHAFSRNQLATIRVLRTLPAGIRLGQRREMSSLDVEKVNRLYRCQRNPVTTAPTIS